MSRFRRCTARMMIVAVFVLAAAVVMPAALAAPEAPEILSPHAGQALSSTPVTATGFVDESALFLSIFEGSVQIGGKILDGSGLWQANLEIGGGSHTIYAIATGADFSQSPPSASVTFTVDAPPIAPSFVSPAQNSRTNQTSVTFVGHTDNDTTVTLREGSTVLAAGIPVSDRSFTTTLTFSQGTHTVSATATDAQARTSAAGSVTFTVDLTAPAAPVISAPAEGGASPTGDVTISGTAEAKATVKVYEGTSLLGSSVANGSGSWSVPATNLAAGSHGITARATDVAGNTGPASQVRTFVVDLTAAAVAITTPNDSVFIDDGAITGTASDNYRVARIALVYKTLTGGAVVRSVAGASCIGCGTVSATWSDTDGLGTGAYTVTAVAYDTAGNASSPATITFVQV